MEEEEGEELSLHLRSGQDRQVGEAGDAHQWLVDQDGVHGLFNTVLGLQRGQEQFHFFPVDGTRGQRSWKFIPAYRILTSKTSTAFPVGMVLSILLLILPAFIKGK